MKIKHLFILLFLFSTQGISQETYFESDLVRELFLWKSIIKYIGPFFLAFFIFGWYDFHKEFIRKRNKFRMNWYIAEKIRIGFPFPKERKKYTSKMVKEEFFKEEANTLEWLYKNSNKLNHRQAMQLIYNNLDKLDYKQKYNATPEYLNHKAYKIGEDNYNDYFNEVLWKAFTYSLARAWLVLLAYILFFVFRNLGGF